MLQRSTIYRYIFLYKVFYFDFDSLIFVDDCRWHKKQKTSDNTESISEQGGLFYRNKDATNINFNE